MARYSARLSGISWVEVDGGSVGAGVEGELRAIAGALVGTFDAEIGVTFSGTAGLGARRRARSEEGGARSRGPGERSGERKAGNEEQQVKSEESRVAGEKPRVMGEEPTATSL